MQTTPVAMPVFLFVLTCMYPCVITITAQYNTILGECMALRGEPNEPSITYHAMNHAV